MSRAEQTEPRDITDEIGPLDGDAEVPMYSFNRAAYNFWQGAFEALISAGVAENEALEWLQSKHSRWLMDGSDDTVQELGRALTAKYIKRNGTAI